MKARHILGNVCSDDGRPFSEEGLRNPRRTEQCPFLGPWAQRLRHDLVKRCARVLSRGIAVDNLAYFDP